MDDDMGSCSLLSSDSDNDNSICNPEKNFVKTDYRLKFDSESSGNDETMEDINDTQRNESSIENDKSLHNNNQYEVEKENSNIKARTEKNQNRRKISKNQKIKNNSFEEVDDNKNEPTTSKDWKSNSMNTGEWSSREYNNADSDRYKSMRKEREMLGSRGVRHIWGHSPTRTELEQVFAEYESMMQEKLKNEKDLLKPKHKKSKKELSSSDDESSSLSSNSERKNRKHKKKKSKKSKKESKKSKKISKHKKKRKKSISSSASDSSDFETQNTKNKSSKKKKTKSIKADEWVELTKELREEETQRTKKEEAEIIGPQIPEHLLKKSELHEYESKLNLKDQRNMLRGEAAAMAAYAAQGKRIPRRGEIGLSSGEISEFEKVGYVMSGTRHKSMEATRLRKEDQILTAEEKRLLNSFTQDQRKNREETVLNQFRDLIDSKKTKT